LISTVASPAPMRRVPQPRARCGRRARA